MVSHSWENYKHEFQTSSTRLDECISGLSQLFKSYKVDSDSSDLGSLAELDREYSLVFSEAN